MKTEELEQLRSRIETAKEEKAKAEGALEEILKRWKEEFGCGSLEEVALRIKEIRETVRSLIEKYERYMEELRGLVEDE
jgi:hypothetical protein